jgi:hypothetical protein
MTRELGDGMSNLEIDWQYGKIDILLGGLGDLMKTWFVLGRLSCGV